MCTLYLHPRSHIHHVVKRCIVFNITGQTGNAGQTALSIGLIATVYHVWFLKLLIASDRTHNLSLALRKAQHWPVLVMSLKSSPWTPIHYVPVLTSCREAHLSSRASWVDAFSWNTRRQHVWVSQNPEEQLVLCRSYHLKSIECLNLLLNCNFLVISRLRQRQTPAE